MKTISKLKALMEIRLAILIGAFCGLFSMGTAFGQSTYLWTGAADGTNLATLGNYTTNGVVPTGLPNGHGNDGITTEGDTIEWAGSTSSNLVLELPSAPGWPNSGFGSLGLQLVMTPSQENSVQLLSIVPGGAGGTGGSTTIGVDSITNDSVAQSFILGDNVIGTSGFQNFLQLAGRPAGAVHPYVNNSSAASTINGSARWVAGGGTAYTIDFSGTGNWLVNNFLRTDNGGGGVSVQVDGPGTTTWTGTGYIGRDNINTVTVNTNRLLLETSGLLTQGGFPNNITINTNATLEFDEAAQLDSTARPFAGAGTLQINNGTITFSGANTYTGNTLLTGGEFIVNSVETPGTSGPLGVSNFVVFSGGTLGFSVNNVFDYSSRFSPAASQAYTIDTGGQNLTFASALNSTGGTLTKVGSGTLSLAGTNNYSGATTISIGKLVFQGPLNNTANMTVADGATLGVTGNGTQVTPGTLTLGSTSGAILEFNNVSSTTTALIAAHTLSSAGTITFNINSGALTPGQHYPLLTWTTGSTPAVSLGVLNGFIGTLATNGNSIQLNISATAFKWTGINNGNWDTTTANNWVQNGASAVFANGGPALFDDTATGTLTVTIDAGNVLPTAVTVNTVSNAYTINSTSGNGIGGASTFLKAGSATLTLSGGGNGYTGATTVSGGILSVSTLANGGTASDIGAGNNSAASIVLNGGTLQYTGGAVSSDHLFTIGTSGGTLDASGSGAVDLTKTGALSYSGNGPRTLTLTGSDADTNTLSANIADNGGATTLIKSGAGSWTLTGTNTYSGVTTLASGILQIGNGGGSGSLGTGTITDDGTLDFDRTGSLTVSPAVNGAGNVQLDGTGTIVLANNNAYNGTTTINAGTLQVGSGGATGQLNPNGAITDNGTLTFNSTGAFTLNAVVSGTGQVIKQGSGLLKLLGANTWSGGTTIASGATLQFGQGNQGSFTTPVVTNNGTALFVRQDNGVLIFSADIIGSGSLIKDVNNDNSGDVTFNGTNTYTGGTFIKGGGIILGDNSTIGGGSIVGNVVFTNSTVSTVVTRTLTFDRPDDFTFSGNILGNVTGVPGTVALANAGSVVQESAARVILTGSNTYPAGTTVTAGFLQVGAGGTNGSIGNGAVTDNAELDFNRSDNIVFTNGITGAGAVVQLGSGTLTLNSTNDTYTGATTVSNGTLVVVGSVAGELDVSGGTIAAGSTNTVATLNVAGAMNINSGTVLAVLNKTSPSTNTLYAVSGTITATNGTTLKLVNVGPSLAAGDTFFIFDEGVTNGTDVTIVPPVGVTVTNELALNGSVKVLTAVTGRPTLTTTFSAGHINLSWPPAFTGLHVQVQTNSLTKGLSTNWITIPGTDAGDTFSAPVVSTNGSVFYRLAP